MRRLAPYLQELLATGAAAWLILILAVPLIGRPHRDGLPVLALTGYAVGSVICHQLPERSFFVSGVQLPVCGRCTGLYLGAAIGGIAAAWRRAVRLPAQSARQIVIVAAIPTAITLAAEWSGAALLSNAIRATVALPLGAAVAWVLVSAVSRDAGGSRVTLSNS